QEVVGLIADEEVVTRPSNDILNCTDPGSSGRNAGREVHDDTRAEGAVIKCVHAATAIDGAGKGGSVREHEIVLLTATPKMLDASESDDTDRSSTRTVDRPDIRRIR